MPSPCGEGGPLAVDEVSLKHGCYAAYTSSVTFGDSFSSRRSLVAKQAFTSFETIDYIKKQNL